MFDLQPNNRCVPLEGTPTALSPTKTVQKQHLNILLPSINDQTRQRIVRFSSGHEIRLTSDVRALDVLVPLDYTPDFIEVTHVRDDGEDSFIWKPGIPSPFNVNARATYTVDAPEQHGPFLSNDQELANPERPSVPIDASDNLRQRTPQNAEMHEAVNEAGNITPTATPPSTPVGRGRINGPTA